MTILQQLARMLGQNEISEADASAKLDEMLSFEDLKAKAKTEVETEHKAEVETLKAETAKVLAEKVVLETSITSLNAKVKELEETALEVHTKGGTDIPPSADKNDYKTQGVNAKVAALHSHFANKK